MRSSLLCLALALTLACGLALSAPASADVECAGMSWWTYKTGSTPYSYVCGNPWSLDMNAVSNYIQGQCQQGWGWASQYSASGGFSTQIVQVTDPYNPNVVRINYRCKTCVNGPVPVFAAPERHSVALSEAGDIGGGVGGGTTTGVTLVDLPEAERAYYLVDVLTETGAIQVHVDAETGEAHRVDEWQDAGECSQ